LFGTFNTYRYTLRISLIPVILSLFLLACFSQNSIDEEVYIKTKDTQLYANIKGENLDAPILLFLHGGPASPFGVPIFKAYGGHKLEEYFIVVYLHQRGIMKSERVPDDTHKISNYVEDVTYVVQYLEDHFKDKKIFILGHSWGGVLAYLYVLEHQDKIQKLVTVCAPINVSSMMKGRIDMTLKWAEETNNSTAIEELSSLSDTSIYDNPENFMTLSKWTSNAYGGWGKNLSQKKINKAIDYEDQFPQWLQESENIGDLMYREILNIDLKDEISEIEIPLLCITGKYDVDVPWYIVEEEIMNYGGEKTFILFNNSHHMVFIDEEEIFVSTVLLFLKNND